MVRQGSYITMEVRNVSYGTAQGERNYQEDRFVNKSLAINGIENGNGRLMGIMDGHGGSGSAQLVSEKLPEVFKAAIIEEKGDVKKALKETVNSLHELTKDQESGTTLSIVYVPADAETAYVAVLGDSPILIEDRDGKIHTSPEHNVRTNQKELEKAKERGAEYDPSGYIMLAESLYGLQMSRALGDKKIDSILDRTPDIYSVALGENSFIVAGSDGLLDPAHGDTQDVVSYIVELVKSGADARSLVNDAIRRRTGDNVTAIVWSAFEGYKGMNDKEMELPVG